jgi:hypothetical protein
VLGEIVLKAFTTLVIGDYIYKMPTPVRYDGHWCNHEILHRNLSNDLNYEENLVNELKQTDTVIAKINLYTLYNARCHFQNLQKEFPNVKNVILTADACAYDSVTYSDKFDSFIPEYLVYPTMDHHKFILTFDWNNFRKKKKMNLCDFYQNLKFLRGLHWGGNDIDTYLSENFSTNNGQYFHWYKSLAQYYPISEESWDELIINSYRPVTVLETFQKQGWL